MDWLKILIPLAGSKRGLCTWEIRLASPISDYPMNLASTKLEADARVLIYRCNAWRTTLNLLIVDISFLPGKALILLRRHVRKW